jgi:hypothetical protein
VQILQLEPASDSFSQVHLCHPVTDSYQGDFIPSQPHCFAKKNSPGLQMLKKR